jgi:hypothetical protein
MAALRVKVRAEAFKSMLAVDFLQPGFLFLALFLMQRPKTSPTYKSRLLLINNATPKSQPKPARGMQNSKKCRKR